MSDKSTSDNGAGDSVVVTLPGTVDKIIPGGRRHARKAQIVVEGAEIYTERLGSITHCRTPRVMM